MFSKISVISFVSVNYDVILLDVEKLEGVIKQFVVLSLEFRKLEEFFIFSGNK